MTLFFPIYCSLRLVLLLSSSYVLELILLSGGVVLFNLLFSSVLISSYIQWDLFFMTDYISFTIVFIALLVVYTRGYTLVRDTNSHFVVSQILLLFCILVFSTSSFLPLYLCFEASLIPIAYIILKWGVYQDRVLRIYYMIFYTAFFSFPLVVFIALSYSLVYNRLINIYSASIFSCTVWASFLVVFAFLVKLPVYGFHFWLPLAHVEAPTFGSIILAGVLLKLGGVGLYRVLSFVILPIHFMSAVFFVLLVGIIISSAVTCFQSDFKRLIAYSSVVHITIVGALLVYSSPLSVKVAVFVILFHALLSPILFYVVSIVYFIFKTRLIYLFTSILIRSRLLLVLLALSFILSIPTPPFPQFLLEVYGFITILSYRLSYLRPLVLIFTFLSLCFNLIWFIPLYISPSSKSVNVFDTCLLSFSVLFIYVCFLLFFSVLLIVF